MNGLNKPKVVILPSSFPRNSEDVSGIFFKDQAIALARHGADVTVLAPIMHPANKLAISRELFKGITQKEEGPLTIYKMEFYGPFPRAPQANAFVWSHVANRMLKLYSNARGRPDIVHAHNALNAGYVAANWKNKYRIPFILTEHSSSYTQNKYNAWQQKTAFRSIREAAARIAVSPFLANELEKFDYTSSHEKSKRWECIPNLVSERFGPKEPSQKSPLSVRFVNIGLATRVKRQDLLICAFARAFKSEPKCSLTIVGGGPLLKSLKQLAKSEGVESQVSFTDYLPPERVAMILRKSDVLVSSSEYETFGVSIIEALSCGIPVISTKCGGPNSIVREKDGLLIKKNSLDELQDAFLKMKATGSSYDSNDIANSAKERFGEEVIAKRIISSYRHAIDSSIISNS